MAAISWDQLQTTSNSGEVGYWKERALTAEAQLAARPQAKAPDDLREAVRQRLVSFVFQECQPDRGDVFSWFDDRAEQLADAALSVTDARLREAAESELMRVKYGAEFEAIRRFYADRTAERSGVPLINHIVEGLDILHGIGASEIAMRAFCLHPIVQNHNPVDVSSSPAFDLACEYRDRANAYLCRPETDHVWNATGVETLVGKMSRDCAHMLMADKIQNQKDFLIYHLLTHRRAPQLKRYFDLWIDYLAEILSDRRAFIEETSRG